MGTMPEVTQGWSWALQGKKKNEKKMSLRGMVDQNLNPQCKMMLPPPSVFSALGLRICDPQNPQNPDTGISGVKKDESCDVDSMPTLIETWVDTGDAVAHFQFCNTSTSHTVR